MTKTFLEKAQKYIDAKRLEVIESRKRYGHMISELQNSFKELDVGVNSIKIGSEQIIVNDNTPEKISYKEELFWLDEIKKGKSLFVLSVSNDNVGYYGKENLSCSDQSLENLIDIDFVKNVAPSAKIYAPKDLIPWPSIISSSSFKIFITDKSELDNLQKNIKSWCKTEWHDKISRTQKYVFKAENIFCVTVYTGFTEDINQRIAEYEQANQELEIIENSSEFSSVSQAELKKTLSSLIQIEDHPQFGKNIQRIIKEITPMLASSMGEKESVKITRKKVDKAYNYLYKDINIDILKWRDFLIKYQE